MSEMTSGISPCALEDRERLGARRGLDRGQAVRLDDPGERVPHLGIVVHHQAVRRDRAGRREWHAPKVTANRPPLQPRAPAPLRFSHPHLLRPAMTRILPHDHEHRFATRSVHAGQVPEPLAGAVMTPIYQTSTYVQEGLGQHKGYEYARTQNPTREALERNVAALEGGSHGFAFGSGLAALDTVLKLLRSGDHVVCGENVYGGTHRLMERVYGELGLTFTFVDMRDVGQRGAGADPGHPDGLLRDAHQPHDEPGGPRRGRRPDPGARAALRGGQHLRHAATSSVRSSSPRTSCCTRRPST